MDEDTEPSIIPAVCFDTEPLLAYFWDTEGSDVVEDYFAEILQNNIDGCVSEITLCELRYWILRDDERDIMFFHFREFLEETLDLTTVSSTHTWSSASDFKANYAIALGDAFSLATAQTRGTKLIVGADDDFDKIDESIVEIERVRTDPD